MNTANNAQSGTYIVEITQFMRPSGRTVATSTPLPVNTKTKYFDMLKANCHFEAEVLSTGEISLTVSNSTSDVDCEITSNGPEVQAGLVKMLERGGWRKSQTQS